MAGFRADARGALVLDLCVRGLARGFGAAFAFADAARFGLALGREGFGLATLSFVALALGAVRLAVDFGALGCLPGLALRTGAGFRAGFGFAGPLLLREALLLGARLAEALPRFVVFAMILASDAGVALNPRGVLATAPAT